LFLWRLFDGQIIVNLLYKILLSMPRNGCHLAIIEIFINSVISALSQKKAVVCFKMLDEIAKFHLSSLEDKFFFSRFGVYRKPFVSFFAITIE
jgi:hypothetical protein